MEARIGEEHRAKELLSTMAKMGPEADGFDTLLVQLRDDVLAHADHEEREEFPLLRQEHSQEHPSVESATENLLLGPPMAIMDRARDAIRKALGH